MVESFLCALQLSLAFISEKAKDGQLVKISE